MPIVDALRVESIQADENNHEPSAVHARDWPDARPAKEPLENTKTASGNAFKFGNEDNVILQIGKENNRNGRSGAYGIEFAAHGAKQFLRHRQFRFRVFRREP
jgi:hypothetical protein